MKSKKLAGAGMVVGAATTVAAMLIGSSVATAAESHPETAFAFATKGLLPLGPLVKVSSPDGRPVHGELIGLGSVAGASDAGVSGGLLTSDVRAGLATTSVAKLNVASLLRADLIKTTCENGTGSLEIVNGSLLGTSLPRFPFSGQTLDLSPVAKVTLGEETRNTDGTVTVTGIKVSVLTTGGGIPSVPALPAGLPKLPGVGDVVPIAYSSPPADHPGTSDAPDTSAAPAAASLLGLPGLLNLPGLAGPTGLPAAGQAVLTITVGSATCGTGDGDDDGGQGDDPDKGHGTDKDGHHQAADADADADASGSDSGDAPKPRVVEASLPVTG